MSRRKVLFIAESLSVGGAEKALVTLLKILDYSKYDVTLLLISKSGDFIQELDSISGLKVNHIIRPSDSWLASVVNSLKIKAIYQWLPASVVGNYLCNGYDVVIAFCEGYLTKWVGSSSISCRKIAWVHTDMVLNDWPLKTGVFHTIEQEKQAYHNFDSVVAVSRIAADGMKEKFGCSSPNVIYNILDQDIIRKSKAFVPNIPDAKLKLVSVGRLEYVKGYDMLIEAMDILVNERHLDIHLCLVGDGSRRTELEKKVINAGLQNSVSFVGLQSNPYPYVVSADLFVCPSRQEGFNIAILEAMTLGKPIVATNSAGPSEILDHGKYGLVVGNSASGIINGIIQLYDNNEEISKYSKLAISRSTYYGPDAQFQTLYNIIDE